MGLVPVVIVMIRGNGCDNAGRQYGADSHCGVIMMAFVAIPHRVIDLLVNPLVSVPIVVPAAVIVMAAVVVSHALGPIDPL